METLALVFALLTIYLGIIQNTDAVLAADPQRTPASRSKIIASCLLTGNVAISSLVLAIFFGIMAAVGF